MPVKPYHRSKLVQTASASIVVPSWKVTPSRSVKVQVLPSALGS